MLVAAIEEGSLAKAGERVNLVTSAASKRIAQLELDVGTTLLIRHNRGVQPTAAGSALYHRARSIIKETRTLEHFCEQFSPDGVPKVRMAANRSTIVQFLPTDIRCYQARDENSRIDLIEALSGDIPRMVSNQEVDIGIYHARGPAPGVVSHAYRTDRVVLVIPTGHPLAGSEALLLDQARAFDFIGYFPQHSFEAFLALAGAGLTGPLNVKIQVANYEARARMIREGLGIGLMPELIADTYLQQFGLEKIRLNDEWARRQFFVCALERSQLRASASCLFDFLVSLQKP